MMYAFIRLWATIFLRLYFRKTIIYGLEKVPPRGPLILASNHPSAFLEASILTTVMKRPIHFLVRGDMFNPKFKWLFDWTKQIPIYRKKDGITNLRKNASSFDLTYEKLGEGEAVLIFPEAKTVLEKKMRPIQRGTAHLAFGTLPYIKDKEELRIQPVGVNFTEPRIAGTDVVIKFGDSFVTHHGTREDREAIEIFTSQLSESMSPLIIQVDDSMEKNYDVLAAIYFRMLFDNRANTDAHAELQRIASVVNAPISNNIIINQTGEIIRTLKQYKITEALYFPDVIVLNRVGLAMLAILKTIWLIIGGWIWRLIRGIIFNRIKTDTFQAPTTLGVFMVVMPGVSMILLIFFFIAGISIYYILLWLFIMWMGTLVRPPLHVVMKLLLLRMETKSKLKVQVVSLRWEVEKILGKK